MFYCASTLTYIDRREGKEKITLFGNLRVFAQQAGNIVVKECYIDA